MKIITRICRSE